ncbi:hypothetical protein TR51_30480 [Kitasatospora griseola]|uniref:Uncharacterized protein n=1 Tax=Kitasatospora griseola TaxID=2064 RepID=A0A0D0PRT6_KITGR|nr:hypothetical protein [Kitasatospora griseola]KIQ63112.1 hypothetical protein TR51_30480 [Kitasatospora griseola]
MDRSEIARHLNHARAEVEAEAAANARKQGTETPQPAADLSALRQQIGAKFSIPEALRDRLNGTNADELTADAQKLAENFRPNLRTRPYPLVKTGGPAERDLSNGEIDPVKLAARILQRRMAG